MDLRKRSVSLPLLGLLLLLAWVGLRGIGFDDLWYDEYRTMFYIGAAEYGPTTPGETLARVAENAVQTPGYYLLMSRWERLAGDSVFANRYPSTLFGLLAVALLYRAGTAFSGRRVGLAAAVLMGGSAFFTLFLHEMRTYTLVTAAVSAVLWFYWRLLHGKRDPVTLVGFVAAVLALPYTHYYAVMVGGGVALYHLIFAPKNRSWFVVPGLMLLAVIPFLPWLEVMVRGALGIRGDEARVIYSLTPREVVGGVLTEFSGGSPALWMLFAVLGLGFGGRGGRAVLWIAGFTVLLTLGVNVWSQSLSQTRYLLMLFPLLALVAALGVGRLAAVGVPFWLPLGVWLLVGVWQGLNPAYPQRVHNADWYFEWSELLRIVISEGGAGDHLIVQLPRFTGSFGHEPLVEHYLLKTEVDGEVLEYPFFMTQDDYQAAIDDALEGHERLWVSRRADLVDDLDERLFREMLIETGYVDCETYADTSTLDVDLYMNVPAKPMLEFGDGVRVEPNVSEEIDSSLDVTLGWAVAGDVLSTQYSYGVHVLDESGALVAQADAGLPSGRACTVDHLDMGELGAGTYTAGLVIYEWETGERLLIEGRDILRLMTFERD